jgi:SpoVK/Ycf46/Vps4 family AAA+-type ATPase
MTNSEQRKKIPANDVIIQMINHVNNNNMALFYQAVSNYADSFSFTNSTRNSLKTLLNRRPVQMRSLDDLSSALKKLIIPSEVSDKNVFLNESTRYFIETLVLELQHIQAFEFHNIPVRNKILLHGVTGNGKTTIARYIAKRVKLPFIEIKSDEVIDSHLGSTSSNINMIFNQIKEPCILFWDEVDSIGCKRGGSSS